MIIAVPRNPEDAVDEKVIVPLMQSIRFGM